MSGLMILAQQNDTRSIFVWSFVLLAAVVVGFVLVSWVRRQVKAPDEPASVGFTLGDLREMHRKGQMSDVEFERAKNRMLAMMKASKEQQHDEPGP